MWSLSSEDLDSVSNFSSEPFWSATESVVGSISTLSLGTSCYCRFELSFLRLDKILDGCLISAFSLLTFKPVFESCLLIFCLKFCVTAVLVLATELLLIVGLPDSLMEEREGKN